MPSLLDVRDLNIEFPARAEPAAAPQAAVSTRSLLAVRDLSFSIASGEVLGLVGESGSGKSISSLAIMRLLPPQARVSGEIVLADKESSRDLRTLADDAIRQLRGSRLAMIFQEPMTALNPVMRVGDQIAEAVLAHHPLSKQEAWKRAVDAMNEVAIPDPARRARDYPHQLSGGMRQRVMIAMAIVNRPQLLIADEPTTALDVTIQAQILDLIRELQVRLGLAVILVTHDLGIVAQYADDVTILYAARVIEQAASDELFRNPLNPYTRGLLESIPGIDGHHHRRLRAIAGTIPSALRPPSGCRFHPRCPMVIDECSRIDPPLEAKAPQHLVACIRV